MTLRVVLDVDTGTDDAIALIMALHSPELEIVGVTTVAGNASIEDTTRNTLRLLDYLERSDIPVARGAERPMRGRFRFADYYHGESGLTTELPASDMRLEQVDAPRFMQDISRTTREELDIIALGPLTNVAYAIQRESGLADSVRRIVVMGGAVEVGGNVTPFAEFNIHADPQAANIVFDSGIPITLVGLDVGDRVGFGRNDVDWQTGTSRSERLAARIVQGWFDIHPDRDIYVLCDPMTVAAVTAPELFEFRQGSITVDEEGEFRGRTRAQYGPGDVSIALSVDVERAHDYALERLGSVHTT